ncbi:MAG TPA: choice-of-anchor X domain-containing protein, partial [Candidatus Kapabacteria bacterium]|nr:choice-of-anchor X domain-containing protein [Candidatus Kapabacteria bacterium]
ILPMTLTAEVTLYLDPVYSSSGEDLRLTVENLMNSSFPKPKNQLPVLFITGHDFGNGNNFHGIFQQPFNGLPCFRDTLLQAGNSFLGIEPYYLDLETSTGDGGIKIDAGKIEEAVNLILLHQGTPGAETKKVVIIAHGNSVISTRYYLKNLWERQNKRLSFHPVSEFIAISPPNDDLNDAPSDFCRQLFASAVPAPGSRGNNEPIENGILYVTLPANRNSDMVHMPEVIGKALYTAFYHQAPPEESVFKSSDEKNPLSPPIIPPLQIPRRDAGIVLLFDISAGMSHSLPAIQKAAESFLQSLNDYCRNSNNKVNLGIAVFPPPGNNQDECRGQVISPMALVTETAVANAVKAIHCLKAQGNNPLLQGIDTALQMFSAENRKVIILISDGHYDCPVTVNINMEDIAIKSRIANLDETGVAFYAVALGQNMNSGHDLLRRLTANRPKNLAGKFIPVNETNPAASLHEAYQSILAEIMEPEEAGTGIKMKPGFDKTSYDTGDTITLTATITKYGNPLPGLTDISVTVTPPNKSFTGVQGAVFQKSPLVAEGIKLYDDGSHGDREKGDGIYTNQYTETVNEGTYRFLFHAAGDTFIKEKKESIYVAVKADPVYSSLNIRWRDIFVGQQEQYLYDIEFAPRDRYGNNIGTGHTVEVAIDYKDKVKLKADIDHSFQLQENPDGTYSGEIGILRTGLETGARLVLMIDGKPFTEIKKIPGFKKWSLGIHGGVGFPISNSKRRHSAGINYCGNIGYRLTPTFSLVGLVGYNYFSSSSSLSSDGRWWNISANLRSEIVKNPLRFYINAGAGLYISKSGVLKSGVNVGTGAAYSWRSNYSIELGADFHLVDSLGNDSTFLVTHAGLIYRL